MARGPVTWKRDWTLAETMSVGLFSLTLASFPFEAAADVVTVEIVLEEGQVVPGGTSPVATILHVPVVEADGTIAVRGALEADGDDDFIFIDDEIVWLNSNEMAYEFTGSSSYLGTAGDRFVYSPRLGNDELIYTDLGLLSGDGDQAPGFASGVLTVSHREMIMTPTGAVWWIMAVNYEGGQSPQGVGLMRSGDGTLAATEVVVADGDLIGGHTIAGTGGGVAVSRNEEHWAALMPTEFGSVVLVNGAVVETLGEPGDDGLALTSVFHVDIDSGGNYVVTGLAGSGGRIGYNGAVTVGSGDVVDGVLLSGAPRMAALNDAARMVHVWGPNGDPRTVFFGCDPANLAETSFALLTDGDELDINGDGEGDGLVVTNINSGINVPSRPLSDAGDVALRVELDDAGQTRRAVVRLFATCCGNGELDPRETCDDGNLDDGDDCDSSCGVTLIDKDAPGTDSGGSTGTGGIETDGDTVTGNATDGDGTSGGADVTTGPQAESSATDSGSTTGSTVGTTGAPAPGSSDDGGSAVTGSAGESGEDVGGDESGGGGCGCSESGDRGGWGWLSLLLLVPLRRRPSSWRTIR